MHSMKRQVARSIKRGPANARSQEAAHRQARVSKSGAGIPQHQQVQMSEPGAGRLRAPLALWGDARGRSQGVSAARLLQDRVSMGGHTAENRAGERRRRREAASKSCDFSMAVARARARSWRVARVNKTKAVGRRLTLQRSNWHSLL